MTKFVVEEIQSDLYDLEIWENGVDIFALTSEDIVELYKMLSQVIDTHGYSLDD